MKISDWLAQEWARQIGPALSSMTGEAVQAESAGGDGEQPGGEVLHIARRLSGSPEAVLRLAISPELWRTAGAAVLRGAGLQAEDEAEVRNAFLEALQQSLGQLAVSLGRRLGREVGWEDDEGGSAPETGAEWAAVDVSGGGIRGRAWVSANSAFVLEDGREEEAAGEPEAAAAAGPRRPMLDLLMEVELPVGVTFGRTQLPLKDAIKLTSGSIVELNRSIIEPVEVIVNNCVIARGEVVVYEGNYAVRIQQIVSREERLRTLF